MAHWLYKLPDQLDDDDGNDDELSSKWGISNSQTRASPNKSLAKEIKVG